jgi:hypothetical protein
MSQLDNLLMLYNKLINQSTMIQTMSVSWDGHRAPMRKKSSEQV